MRIIGLPSVSCFFLFQLSYAFAAWALYQQIPSGIGVLVSIGAFLMLNLGTIAVWSRIFPFPIGDLPFHGFQNFSWGVYNLFTLFYVQRILASGLLPAPIATPFYRFLGAKIGKGSFVVGLIADPQLVSIGRGCIPGYGSVIMPHVMTMKRMTHGRIEIGDDVTIGVYAVVYGPCKIGNRSTVAALSLVTPGTVIGDDELWGGIPAKCIKKLNTSQDRPAFVADQL